MWDATVSGTKEYLYTTSDWCGCTSSTGILSSVGKWQHVEWRWIQLSYNLLDSLSKLVDWLFGANHWVKIRKCQESRASSRKEELLEYSVLNTSSAVIVVFLLPECAKCGSGNHASGWEVLQTLNYYWTNIWVRYLQPLYRTEFSVPRTEVV